ncbi:4-hydroxythreonine-4-phosphate dehydrogenase PdxA [Allorhodopirellula solitaria]|uniref:4-hydroxythreonine-4-phosphate dehydrogenase n=1 Tax=Allorhodopirellula solitaria TaxID=2527987 RepID=A0A5C5YHQ9_9BACT|nr:4-hydroxythreonine-4-phosphate dehydrogenase PdxA [Allorhodopirellula solitaria]TWT73162.1 4-hydroxythreonine-4-phosphate dehydrogenase [Allorhodopirellula solitaria]
MSDSSTKLAITMGEASGVGPEIALRVWQRPEVRSQGMPLLMGDARLFERVAHALNLPLPPAIALDQIGTIPPDAAGFIVDCGHLNADDVVPGRYGAETGRASYQTVCEAIDATARGDVSAMITGPIQKEAWMQAGIEFPGHTELLAHRVGTALGAGGTSQIAPADVRMMLASDTIACVLETIHIPLADVPGLLNPVSLARTIGMAGEAIGRRNAHRGSLLPPRIGVCGLNPHAGEHGMFSHGEEDRIVIPAIEAARGQGWEVVGPLPPDTAFTPAMRERIDVYVCLYHDQGLIPLKALSFDDAVNVTLGLPIVRTSVDHGTAMDLAWQGRASIESMIAAIRMAAELVESVP